MVAQTPGSSKFLALWPICSKPLKSPSRVVTSRFRINSSGLPYALLGTLFVLILPPKFVACFPANSRPFLLNPQLPGLGLAFINHVLVIYQRPVSYFDALTIFNYNLPQQPRFHIQPPL